MEQQIKSKLEKYFEVTAEAIKKVKISKNLNAKSKISAEEIFDLSKRYYEDAKYFEKKGDILNAYGAVVYSHAFLDVGARIGLFDVDDDRLFMVD